MSSEVSSVGSVASAGSSFSRINDTSAMPAGPRAPSGPVKITSSMASPRSRFADCSPSTQRRASTRFDLPHPLGPTMPLIPLENSRLVGSTKDLKPNRSRRLMRMAAVVTHAPERVKVKTLQNVASHVAYHYILEPLTVDELRIPVRGVHCREER